MDYTTYDFYNDMENGYGEDYYRGQYSDSDDEILSHSYRPVSNNNVITSAEGALSYFRRQEMQREERQKLENEKHKEDAKVRKQALIEWKKNNQEIFNKIKSKSYEVHERCYNRIERDIKDAFPDIFKGRERSLEELFDYIKEGFNEDDEEYIFLHFTDPAEDTIDPDYGWIPDNLMQCIFKGYPVCKNIYHPKTIERLESQKKQLREKEGLRREKEREREREKERREREKEDKEREREIDR